MIKRWLILLNLVLLIPCFAFSQINYVMNPSFEIYSSCPEDPTLISLATYWNNADSISSYSCGPSYINRCAEIGSLVAIPEGWLGGGLYYYHYPRTGNGMAGTGFYSDSSASFVKTYLQGHLLNKLIAGKSYCVTFYVALIQGLVYAVRHIGAYFDDGHIDSNIISNSGCLLTEIVFPQIIEDSFIADTTGWYISIFKMPRYDTFPEDSGIYDRIWTKVQGSFIAGGNESFITLGNFDTNNSMDTLRIQAESANAASSYFIDDVSVVESDAVADAGPDTVYIAAAGDSLWIGNDTAAVGGGAGMPCWWYTAAAGTGSPAIDSGGRIMVHPDTTTTYIMMMDLCGNQTYDTITVKIGPNSVPMYHLMHLDVFPDPLTSLTPALSINGEGAAGFIYKITNVLGKTITAGLLTGNTNTLYLPQLLPGIYLFDITDPESGARVVKRVVKE